MEFHGQGAIGWEVIFLYRDFPLALKSHHLIGCLSCDFSWAESVIYKEITDREISSSV